MALDERSLDSDLDDTVPNARAVDESADTPPGADPLLVHPVMSSGLTGNIVRPGDHTPRWAVPLFTVGCLGFIALLLVISS